MKKARTPSQYLMLDEHEIWRRKQKLKAILNASYKSISSIESDADLTVANVKASILVNPKYLEDVKNIEDRS